ncbi:MarR family transcriptional regulator [Halorubrum ezzemoulense]|uniref:MarR family transcriptional regulator n=1 Tax=Halorubrum ezzemoulense TaxID=337243 RepID=UPI00232ECFFC|nr:MarR family transcriptional regulator [Halorubrum ezzemoulense]MDB9281557.1 MarR family transcriptional regulator [Halorubrum ezzemoulense]MDB9285074.1 MarR family transcriptional regulator [Halorubrum ezzemoulense]
MYSVDERILEHLSEESWASPSTMAAEAEFQSIEADEGYIQQRCRQLVQRELIVPLTNSGNMYEITRWGLAYLRGDLDAAHLLQWQDRNSSKYGRWE